MAGPVGIGILVPVEFELFEPTIAFYRDIVCLPVVERGTSEAGNPWYTFQAVTTTLTIHTGRDGNFPYPEFRPTGHGLALAFEVQGFSAMLDRLDRQEVEILNRWSYSDDEFAVSIADPSGNRIELRGNAQSDSNGSQFG